MSRLLRTVATLIELLSVFLFGVLLFFWIIVAVKTVCNFTEGGIAEVKRWYFRIALRPEEMFPHATPDWRTVALRFVGLAAMTVVLGFVSRRAVNRIRRHNGNSPNG
jgi:hypothetical protein